jgi:hypothetical protein
MPPGALNLLVFREDSCRVNGRALKSAVEQEIAGLTLTSSADQILHALLRAGELECGVSDSDSVPVGPYEPLTDRLAAALVSGAFVPAAGALSASAAGAAVPDQIAISRPEGFAYYAIHPSGYADALKQLSFRCESVAVIGIRSIGVTLSAVTVAAARARGLRAERITVRPGGHPYNRRTEFSPPQLQFVRDFLGFAADFLIVDEGPGLSGSSFLSVAEALCRCGVAAGRITLLCGHQPDFDFFRADDGPRRARRFRWLPVSSGPRKPEEAKLFVGGGQWRPLLLPDVSTWPASWISLERLKYLGPDHGHRRLFKFLGLGHYGETVFEREKQIANAGFGISPQREDHGFASYDWVPVRPMSAEDLTEDMLRRLAAYCSFRAHAFAAESTGLDALQQMAEHNAEQMGIELGIRLRFKLERPVVADGRMLPHEWLCRSDGQVLKSDCGCHGDDHFYPGPTDIAWDLAGAIVEWRMSGAQAKYFLEAYRRASDDDPHKRIDDFVAAYAIFRRAYCLMAANALQGTEEQERLERAAAGYLVAVAATVST